ncbi:MAG TPA: hypothetical protein VKG86_03445, partial [Terracidiphilus sp.]|nr:hypothetical protein [Terracidiphilus sp.]
MKQDSLYYWGNTTGQTDQSCWRVEPRDDDTAMEYVSAFTVAELGQSCRKRFYGMTSSRSAWGAESTAAAGAT